MSVGGMVTGSSRCECGSQSSETRMSSSLSEYLIDFIV